MALHEGWWMLNRGDGWCMPPGTTWGTDGTWAYRDAHGLSNEEMVAHGFDDYLWSIGAVPVAEMCARVEAAEKKLADVMAKGAELYEEGKRIAHASEAIVRRAEAAEKDADTWKRRAELLMERHRGAAFHAFLCCHPQKSFDKRKHLEAASVRSAFRAIRDHLNGSRTWEGCAACQYEAKVQQSQGDTLFPETSVVWQRLDAAVEAEKEQAHE